MGWRPWVLGVLAGGVLIALGIAAYQMGIDEGKKRARGEQPATAQKPSPPKAPAGPGKELFGANCASCHTLEAAGASGQAGPDLDELQPAEAQVLSAIEKGGTGSGQMPPNLVRGTQAEQVAEFVAAATGP